jgi:hypothetical protein
MASDAPDDALRQLAEAATVGSPEEGLRAAAALRRLADRLEAAQVAHARRVGWSWQSIAEALGVSRQAVHQRYAPTEKEQAMLDLERARREIRLDEQAERAALERARDRRARAT